MKHFCGGQVLERKEESLFYCSRCPKKFVSLKDVEDDNRVVEQSDEQYEYEEEGVEK